VPRSASSKHGRRRPERPRLGASVDVEARQKTALFTLPQRWTAPNFRPISLVAKWLDISRCHLIWGRPRPKRHCSKRGANSPPQKWGGTPPQFSSDVYCGQTTGWIKMPLGTEVEVGRRHIVLDGDPATRPQKGGTWYGGRTRPRPHCARWGPSYPSPKRGHSPPNFWPMFIAAKRLDGSRCN